MPLPSQIREQVLSELKKRIEEGESLLKGGDKIAPVYGNGRIAGGHPWIEREGYLRINVEQFIYWRTRATNLLSQLVGTDSLHREHVEYLSKSSGTEDVVVFGNSLLKATKDDFEAGLLDNLERLIEAEISSDYLSAASGLIRGEPSNKFDHVPAAVLAGAVLEHSLRTLCASQKPPVSLVDANGDKKTLAPLIEDLKKVGLFNELKAKQLRYWAGVRNKAAHGEFESFKRADVEQMILGIDHFLADYLK